MHVAGLKRALGLLSHAGRVFGLAAAFGGYLHGSGQEALRVGAGFRGG